MPRIAWNELIVFTKQLSGALKMQLPLHEAILAEAEQSPKRWRKSLTEIAKDLESGERLSIAMMKWQTLFPPAYREMVHIGEESGTLPDMLDLLAEDIRHSHENRMKMKNLFAYPAFLFLFALVDAMFIMVFVMPRISAIYGSFNFPLPCVTVWIVESMSFLKRYSLAIIALAVFGMIALWYRSSLSGESLTARIFWMIPAGRRLIRNLETARLCSSLRSLLGAGVPLDQSLNYSAQVADSGRMRAILESLANDIQSGKRLSESLRGGFPASLAWMVSSAEKRGDLPQNLDSMAKFYEDEAESMRAIFSQVLEPVIILSIAVVVGFFVVGLYMPVFGISSAIGLLD